MDELRFVRRDDRSLILANEADEEFRLVVDDAVLAELKHLNRREPAVGKVRPREIQALIRAGKTRAEVMAETGAEEADVERYEEPVLAERRYILERAHAVPVRTDATEENEEKFGEVIAERLVSLGADASEWSSWKDEATGWMVALEFISRDVAHRAVWAFEHRTGVLSPENPDAVSLSKQGDVGDRLIPKLRAVDDREKSGRFDSGAFDTNELGGAYGEADGGQSAGSADAPGASADTGSGSGSGSGRADGAGRTDAGSRSEQDDAAAEYERRREIDQRAIKTSDDSPEDLSQTADLLDALRKRRGERDQRGARPSEPVGNHPAGTQQPEREHPTAEQPTLDVPMPEDEAPRPKPRSIWGGAGVSSDAGPSAGPGAGRDANPGAPQVPRLVERPSPADRGSEGGSNGGSNGDEPAETERSPRKGRASIPSWDDILFGTRSDEDPAD